MKNKIFLNFVSMETYRRMYPDPEEYGELRYDMNHPMWGSRNRPRMSFMDERKITLAFRDDDPSDLEVRGYTFYYDGELCEDGIQYEWWKEYGERRRILTEVRAVEAIDPDL